MMTNGVGAIIGGYASGAWWMPSRYMPKAEDW